VNEEGMIEIEEQLTFNPFHSILMDNLAETFFGLVNDTENDSLKFIDS
jgi:hypothetical protein